MPEYFGIYDIQNLLRGISTLTEQERDLVEKELMAKYKPDYRLTKSELINTVIGLANKYKISDNDKRSIFKRFEITDDEIRIYRY